MVSFNPPAFEKVSPPFRVDDTGTVRIGTSRITLDLIIEAYHLGQTPEYMAEGWPTITLAEVYSTIAYYLSHREQIDPYLQERDRYAEELRKIIEADPRHKALGEKFRRIKAEREGKTSGQPAR